MSITYSSLQSISYSGVINPNTAINVTSGATDAFLYIDWNNLSGTLGPPTVTDNKSQTWTLQTQNTSGSGGNAAIYHCSSPGVGSTNVVATFSSSATGTYVAFYTSGSNGADVSANNHDSNFQGTGTNAVQGAAITPVTNNDDIISFMRAVTGGGTNIALTSGTSPLAFTSLLSNTSIGLLIQKYSQTTAATVTPTATSNTNSDVLTLTYALKAATGGGATTYSKTFSIKNGMDVNNTIFLDNSLNLTNIASLNVNVSNVTTLNIMSDFNVANGSMTSPPIGFSYTGSPSLGLYLAANNVLGITANGNGVINVSQTSVNISVGSSLNVLSNIATPLANIATLNVSTSANVASLNCYGIIAANASPLSNARTQPVTALLALRKTAGACTSSTTLTADANLTITFNETGWYRLRVHLPYYATANGLGGINWDLGSNTCVTANINMFSYGYSNANISFGTAVTTNTASRNAPNVSISATSPSWWTSEGTLTVTTTGTLGVRWAQNVSSANALNMMQGAYLEAMKIG